MSTAEISSCLPGHTEEDFQPEYSGRMIPRESTASNQQLEGGERAGTSSEDEEVSSTSENDRIRSLREGAKTDLDMIKRETLERIRHEQENLRQKVHEIVDDMLEQIVEYVQEYQF